MILSRRNLLSILVGARFGAAATKPEEAFAALQATLHAAPPMKLRFEVADSFLWDAQATGKLGHRTFAATSAELMATPGSYLVQHKNPSAKSVESYRQGVLTRFTEFTKSYSRFEFPEHQRSPWPTYSGDDCLFLLKKGPFAALFFKPEGPIEIFPVGEGWELHFASKDHRLQQYNFRYVFPNRRAKPSALIVATRAAGKNEVQGRRSSRYEFHWSDLTMADRNLIESWTPPRNARWLRGKESGIEAEREASR